MKLASLAQRSGARCRRFVDASGPRLPKGPAYGKASLLAKEKLQFLKTIDTSGVMCKSRKVGFVGGRRSTLRGDLVLDPLGRAPPELRLGILRFSEPVLPYHTA